MFWTPRRRFPSRHLWRRREQRPTATRFRAWCAVSRRPHDRVAGAAGDLVVRLAEALEAPVFTTTLGKGAIPEDHPLDHTTTTAFKIRHQGQQLSHGFAGFRLTTELPQNRGPDERIPKIFRRIETFGIEQGSLIVTLIVMNRLCVNRWMCTQPKRKS